MILYLNFTLGGIMMITEGKTYRKLAGNYIIFVLLVAILKLKFSGFKVNNTYYDLKLVYFITALSVSLYFLYKFYKLKRSTYHV